MNKNRVWITHSEQDGYWLRMETATQSAGVAIPKQGGTIVNAVLRAVAEELRPVRKGVHALRVKGACAWIRPRSCPES